MKDLIDFLADSQMPRKKKPTRQISISKKHKPLMQQKRLSTHHDNHSVLAILKNEYNNSKKVVRSAGQHTLNRNSMTMSMQSMSITNLSMMSDGSIDSFISDLDDDEEENHAIKYKNHPAHYTHMAVKDDQRDNADSAETKRISPPRPDRLNTAVIAGVSEVSDYVNDKQLRQSNLPDTDDEYHSSSISDISDISNISDNLIPPISPLPSAQKLTIKKSVQFSNVDEIKRHTATEDYNTSKSTQTIELKHHQFSELSKQDLISELIALKQEKMEYEERFHLLIDENSDYVKKYDTVSRTKDELYTKHDQVMSQFTLLKSDYSTLQNTLMQTRQQLTQSNSKSTELEKLSTRALKKIKDLDGENKFLGMQVDWLRNKISHMDIDPDLNDDSSFSSSVTSLSSYEKPTKKKNLKKKKRKESGWETERS